MALLEEDKAAIKRVAHLLTGDHQGASTKATILEAQMLEVASCHVRSGNGALGSWIVSMSALAKHLLVFTDEARERRRNLKI